ncbi:MAG: hypothetical protein GKR87_04545 [Kiritimatiellae bacterium]|nr:hypothetical protein [Kiritimatiellia bacterium]
MNLDIGKPQSGRMVRPHELVALFMAALASLFFEITITKIFEFSVWANYAYLVPESVRQNLTIFHYLLG